MWFYPVLGYMPYNAAATGKAKQDLSRALAVLDAHLLDKTYLVGNKVTLADIVVVSALVYPFKFVCDPAFRAPYVNVIRWFETCVNQPAFENVIGKVVLAETELTASGVAALPNPTAPAAAAPAAGKKAGDSKPKEDKPKAEKAPKAPKEDKPKAEKAPKAPKEEKPKPAPKPKEEPEEEEDEPLVPVEKKADHPFKIMDTEAKSPFVMDAWKRCYSNCGGDYKGAMEEFFKTFDPAGWSLWRGDYKYNEENKILFMTSNLIGGFMQRTDEIRKWLFGTLTIRGTEGGLMKITHYFLIRGQEIQPLIDCNSDAECYEWTKVPVSDADKQLLYDYWCSDGPLDGEACLDSRCYK